MGDLISRSALLELFKSLRDEHETSCISYNALYELILQQKTAYDVEAVVAELEKFKELPCGCCGLGCGECEYLESCLTGEEGYKVALDRAISIVKGKEQP